MVELKDELLTVAEAAAVVKVTPHTIYRWIAVGRLPARRYSRRTVRVRREDLENVGLPISTGDLPPEHGTVGILRRHFGGISEEAGEELYRLLMEDREASRSDRG